MNICAIVAPLFCLVPPLRRQRIVSISAPPTQRRGLPTIWSLTAVNHNPSPPNAIDPQKKVVLYTRYSTDMQQPRSSADQERVVRQHLAGLGIDTGDAEVIHDTAQIGSREDRPGFQRLWEMVNGEEVALLAVDQQNRLSRGNNAVPFLEDLKFRGGRFIAVGDNVDTARDGWQIQAGMLQIINAHAKTDRAHAVRRGQQGRVLDGHGSAGDMPYGYASEYLDDDWAEQLQRGRKPAKAVVIDAEAAEWIRWIFSQYVTGKSAAAIARELTAQNAPRPRKCKSGSSWHPYVVQRILDNKKYIGHWVWGKTRTIHSSNGKKKQVPVPEEQWTVRERPELRIIDDRLWQAVRKRREQIHKAYGPKPGENRRGPRVHHTACFPGSMLQGLLICGECGRSMTQQGGGGYRRYGCPRAFLGSCTNNIGVSKDKGEHVLVQLLLERCRTEDGWLDAVYESCVTEIQAARSGEHRQLDTDRQRLEQLVPEIDRLVDAVADGHNFASIQERLRDREQEKRDIERRIREAEAALARNFPLPTPEQVLDQLGDSLNLIQDQPAEAALLMRDLLGQVVVKPVRVPGKKRGWPKLVIDLRGDRLLTWAAKRIDAEHPVGLVTLHEEQHTQRIEIELGAPLRSDHLAPEIERLRQRGVLWKDICGRMELPLSTAYGLLKRYQDRRDANAGSFSQPDSEPEPEPPEQTHGQNQPADGPAPGQGRGPAMARPNPDGEPPEPTHTDHANETDKPEKEHTRQDTQSHARQHPDSTDPPTARDCKQHPHDSDTSQHQAA